MSRLVRAAFATLIIAAPFGVAHAQGASHRSTVRELTTSQPAEFGREHVTPGRQYSAPTGGNPYTHQFPSTDGSDR